MARLDPTPYPMPPLEYDKDRIMESIHAQEDILNELQAKSNALEDGQIVGGLLEFSIADGAAYYLVTKEKPLTLQHIDFLDGYRIPDAHIRGINKADIIARITISRRLAKILGG